MPEFNQVYKKKNIYNDSSISYDSRSNTASIENSPSNTDRSLENLLAIEIHSPPPPLLPLPSIKDETQVVIAEANHVNNNIHKPDSTFSTQQNYLSSLLCFSRHESGSNSTRCNTSLSKAISEVPDSFFLCRYEILEFAFKTLTLLNKIKDTVLFSAFELFDSYLYIQLQGKNQEAIKNEAKEIFLAALVLVSKLENVRHLSLKMCCEITGLPQLSRNKILEKEMCLFLHLNPILHAPTALSFLCGFLGYSGAEKKTKEPKVYSREVAYHLAVYILTLNLMDITSRRWTAQQLGTACAWIVTLLLRCPMTPVMKHVAVTVNSEEYSLICHQVMKRALQNCQKENSQINRHFASPFRCRVADILRKAAHTRTGTIFLSC